MVVGEQVRYCKICQAAVIDDIPIPAAIEDRLHTFFDTVVPPTEADEGYTVRTCTLCPYVIARTAVVPALYALLADSNTVTEAPTGAAALLMSDTATHRLSHSVGSETAVSAELARRFAVALAVTEELAREGTELTPESTLQLISGVGAGNSYSVGELLMEWLADGDPAVAEGFAAAIDGQNAAFSARVAARLQRLGVLGAVTVDPFSAAEPGSATLGGTGVLLARVLDEPLLVDALSELVPRLLRIAGKKPVAYMTLDEGLRASAIEDGAGGYHFLLLWGEALTSDMENTLFLSALQQ